jgi:serine protease Do
MRRHASLLAVAVCAMVGWVAPSAAQGAGAAVEPLPAEGLRGAVEAAVAAVTPALVRIHVVEVGYYGGREMKSEATGSGVVFGKEGYVITNHHVAGNSKQLLCMLADESEVDAELVGSDPLTDIAVLKMTPDQPRDFPVARFGDSDKMQVGDHVLALGSPLALSQSATMGIVSNTAMVIPDLFWPFTFEVDGEDVGSVVRWIGHDAKLSGGNSGGALVNLAGEVVGINEMSFGLWGAIPSNLAMAVARGIVKNGKVVRAWIGLDVQPMLRSESQVAGVLVAGTIPGSPAEKAGLKSGDVLVSLAGHPVSVRVPEELPIFNRLVADLPVGRPAEAQVMREGKGIALQVTPEERQGARPKARELEEWGITARDLSLMAAKELKRDTREGVLVTSVRPGGPCDDAKPKIAENDIIMAVGERPTKTLQDLLAITAQVTESKAEPTPVTVAFDRRSERLLTVVKVGKEPVPEPEREVRKAWLPVATQVLTRELAEGLGMADKTGVRVTQVYPGSSAAKAGLQVGDIIVALDGEGIPASRPEHLEVFPTMIRQRRIGSEVELTVIRGKPAEETKIAVTLEQSQPEPREYKRYRNDDFEFTVRDLAFDDRVRQKLLDVPQQAACVDAVTEGGWAALAHLAVGDLILSVGGKATPDAASVDQQMKVVAQTKPETVVFQVKRGIHELFIELKPKWPKGA